MTSETVDTADSARRGRRPQTPEEAERMRALILDASAEVFAEQGFHRMTVEQILRRASIARPTFYRYFDSVADAANGVLERTDQSILAAVIGAFNSGEGLAVKVAGAVAAYLEWARGRGPLLKAMYAELHDPTSPVSEHRQTVQHVLADAIRDQFRLVGKPVPNDFDIDLALNIVIYAGFKLHLEGDATDEELRHARESVERVVITLLEIP